MPHSTPLITILVYGFVLALIAGVTAQKLKLSPLVGYLLAGVLLGSSTPGVVADAELASELLEIGVILLMFGVGLHFSMADLLEVKWIAIPGAVSQIALTTLVGMGFAWYLGWPIGTGLVFGLALSVASTVVLLRSLEERRLLESTRGRIAIGWLVVQDLAMVLVLVLLPAIAPLLGGDAGADAPTGSIWVALGITLGKVAAFIAVMLIVGRRVIPWLLERVAGLGSRELFTLCVLAISLGVAYASAMLFDVSFALGAFFAGMMLKESKLSQEAAEDSLPLRDAFAVLFFVSVGMLFDPSIIIREPLKVFATFLIIVIGNPLVAMLIVRAFRYPKQTAFTIAASLGQIGEFSFILAALGISLKLLPVEARDLILAGSILSILANPLLFVALDHWNARRDAAEHERKATEAQDVFDAEDAEDADNDILPDRDSIPDANHIILVGYGRVGSRIARRLIELEIPFVLIDDIKPICREARKLGIRCVLGNAVNPEVIADANIATARGLVVAVSQTMEAGNIIRAARETNPGLAILARGHSDADIAYLLKSGADATVMGESEIARSISDSVESLMKLAPRLELNTINP
ncbi:MAG: YbaL family putative K(+) efflux transporter [Dokdonella sp.]